MTQFLRSARRQLAMPALFLAVSALAFGLQAPWLGYYLDDWIILNAYLLGGAERLFEYAFLGNRPLVFWQWWLGFKLLGAAPLGWQLWALLWRWLTVVILWLGWRRLWPDAPAPDRLRRAAVRRLPAVPAAVVRADFQLPLDQLLPLRPVALLDDPLGPAPAALLPAAAGRAAGGFPAALLAGVLRRAGAVPPGGAVAGAARAVWRALAGRGCAACC
jgi:hypothetical protein